MLKNKIRKNLLLIKDLLITPYLLIALAPIFFASALAAEAPKGDGHLVIYSYHLDELLEVTYKTNGVYNQASLEKIYRVMRSPDGAVHEINIKLIELIDSIQDHFKADCIEIISGYRSPEYNKRLKDEGHSVAQESLHTKGLAADIHIDEVTEKALRDYARSLKAGGVGFYPDFNFVHVDVGQVREWGERRGGRKLIGVDIEKTPPTIITDKNFYFQSEEIRLNRPPKQSLFEVERFRRGRWVTFSKASIKRQEGGAILLLTEKELVPGKYRLKMDNTFSNEFYIKII